MQNTGRSDAARVSASHVQHTLARNDHLLGALRPLRELRFGQRRAMPIGANRSQRLALGLEQHAVSAQSGEHWPELLDSLSRSQMQLA